MLSTRLLQRIEMHWEAIAQAVVDQFRSDPHTPHHQEFDQEEVLARARDLVHHLGLWLASPDDEMVGRRYREVGHARQADGTPLAEVVYRLQLIELKTAEYVQSENAATTAVEVYAELEMLRSLHRFFASVIYNVVVGYEEAAITTRAVAWGRRSVAVSR
jgi:hypothetical protein